MKRVLLAGLFLLSLFTTYGQTESIVQTDGITSDIHRSNIGRIAFLSRNIPLNECKPTNFLTQLELTPQNNLYISVFMNNSITNYMHELAPELSAEELNSKGNYQFSFYVDNKLIYPENIHHGCGLRKSETTTFCVPLIDTSGGDWWSVYLFDRFKNNGGDKALSGGKHKIKVEIRPYVKTDESSNAKTES